MQIHPTASDLADAMRSISVVITQIDPPLTALANQFNSDQTSTAMHVRRMHVRELAVQWASIITISEGREVPLASDLFTIYSEMLNLQSYSSSLTRMDRLGQQTSLLEDATKVTRGQTELLNSVETLMYAVADQIDSQEKNCRAVIKKPLP